MKKYFLIVAATLGTVLVLAACGGDKVSDASDNITETKAENQADILGENETTSSEDIELTSDENETENEEETGGQTEMKMNVQVGDYTFTATLENNTAVDELVDMMKEGPVTISMDDYS